MLNQFEQNAQWNEELLRTQVSLCNIINKYKLSGACINALLNEFAKTGYTVITTDIALSDDSTPFKEFCFVFDLHKEDVLDIKEPITLKSLHKELQEIKDTLATILHASL
jgi:hypothetical protein